MSLPKSIATVHSILMIVINVYLWLGLLALFWCFLWWFCVEVELHVKWIIEILIKGQKEQFFDKLILLKGFSWPRQKNNWPGAWVSSEYNWSDWQAGKET